jgi:uncharacterized protein YbjT (DUF2867 family)
MTRVLILGANGQLARNTTRFFLDRTDAQLTLYLRRASRLRNPDPARVTIVEADVLDRQALQAAGLKRLIFISSMGIDGEVPGERYSSVLDPYRDSAAVIEGPGTAVHPPARRTLAWAVAGSGRRGGIRGKVGTNRP